MHLTSRGTLVILITSSGEFSCIYIYIYILVFSMCLILFHFILFLSNFTPFGRVVFIPCLVFWFVLVAGVSSSGLEIVNQG